MVVVMGSIASVHGLSLAARLPQSDMLLEVEPVAILSASEAVVETGAFLDAQSVHVRASIVVGTSADWTELQLYLVTAVLVLKTQLA